MEAGRGGADLIYSRTLRFQSNHTDGQKRDLAN